MIVYVCNECGITIPIIEKTIWTGEKIKVLDCGQLKCEQIDVSVLKHPDVHYCKSCAEKISAKLDYELLKTKTAILSGQRY